MLVFVVPLQSAKVSTSWERVCKLLERTLRSLCNQTSEQFQVIVVCHEKPTLSFSHSHVHYLEVDFPPPVSTCEEKRVSLDAKHTDKGRKMMAGLVAAKHYQPSHTMLFDADDCVSNRLAEFVAHRPDENGWMITRGYRYEESRKKLYFKRNFYTMCGSCNILRYDLNFLPENPRYDRGYGYYKYYIDHAKVGHILAEAGKPLSPLPFPGAVYITATGENIYYSKKRLSPNFLTFLNLRHLNPNLSKELGLYSISES